MEVSWRKVTGNLVFLCTVVSAARMPYRRDFHLKPIQDIIVDRTALDRTAVVPPPNIPHIAGNPPKPVHQPWYRHFRENTKQNTRTSQRQNKRLRIHKHFDDIEVHSMGSRLNQHEVPNKMKMKQVHDEYSSKNELAKLSDLKIVDDTEIPNIEILLHRHARRMNQLKRNKAKKFSRRRGRHPRRKLSSFKKGCRMRRTCSVNKVHYRPVCGSDGVTYDNKCMLKVAACMKGSRHAIRVTNPSACQKQRPL